MTAANDLALPPQAEAARLKLQLRAAQRELGAAQAAVDHLTEVGAGDAVAQLQARLLPMIDERRRAHDAELEAARKESADRIAAAELDLGAAPASLFAAPISWVAPSDTGGTAQAGDDGDIVAWREPETDHVNGAVVAGTLAVAAAAVHDEPELVEVVPAGDGGELPPAQDPFGPPTGDPWPTADELAESVDASRVPSALTGEPSSPWAPPAASVVEPSIAESDETGSTDVALDRESESDSTPGSELDEIVRQIADLVEARLRGDDVVGDRLPARSAANDVRIVFDSASFGEALGTALGATSGDRPAQPVYQSPPKSFWANTWHADVLLSVIALIIVIVVLIAWAT